jgi:dephospho-CoA kinase
MKLNVLLDGLFEQATDRPIILVFGRLCSGKGTYCAPFKQSGYEHIATSDVVKRVSGLKTRGKLQHTADLGPAIAQELVDLIGRKDKVIVDGIRQTEIVDAIVSRFGRDNIEMVWLDAPDEVRKARFDKRGAAKDDQSFEDADRGDLALGIGEVEKKYKPQSKIVDHG